MSSISSENTENEAITSLHAVDEEIAWEKSLRPLSLADYIGQTAIKDSLDVFLKASQHRRSPLDHILLYGPPGLGKTTLAHIIASEQGATLKTTSGPAILKAGDLAALLSSLEEGDVLFIDEIHRLPRIVEEILYPAMEDYHLDLMVGRGPGARSIQLKLKHFTLIGATTRASLISSPLRDRFGAVFHLHFYEPQEIEQIINRSAGLLEIPMDEGVNTIVAQRSRRTPRIANRLLRRIRDFAQVRGNGVITKDIVDMGMTQLGVDSLGLDTIDRQILNALARKFAGGPVGIDTLSASSGEDRDTIEEMYEPFWLQMGLIDRTPRGRVLTQLGYKHLGLAHTLSL